MRSQDASFPVAVLLLVTVTAVIAVTAGAGSRPDEIVGQVPLIDVFDFPIDNLKPHVWALRDEFVNPSQTPAFYMCYDFVTELLSIFTPQYSTGSSE